MLQRSCEPLSSSAIEADTELAFREQLRSSVQTFSTAPATSSSQMRELHTPDEDLSTADRASYYMMIKGKQAKYIHIYVYI